MARVDIETIEKVEEKSMEISGEQYCHRKLAWIFVQQGHKSERQTATFFLLEIISKAKINI